MEGILNKVLDLRFPTMEGIDAATGTACGSKRQDLPFRYFTHISVVAYRLENAFDGTL